MQHTNFTAAFQQGTRFLDEDGSTIKVHVVPLAPLVVKSGAITAGDPFTLDFADARPFSKRFPRGDYPVELAVANFSVDNRVAAARVALGKRPVVRYELAYFDGDDPALFDEDDVPVYGVDAGSGCFTDAAWAREENELFDPDLLTRIFDKNYVDTFSYGSLALGEHNLVAFSTGWGDGSYASYYGLSEDGEVQVLVTDFQILVKSIRQEVPLSLPFTKGPLSDGTFDALGVQVQALGPYKVEVVGDCEVSASVRCENRDPTKASYETSGKRRVFYLQDKPKGVAKLVLTFYTGIIAMEPQAP